MLPNKLEKKSAPQYHEVRNEDAKTQSVNSQFKESKTQRNLELLEHNKLIFARRFLPRQAEDFKSNTNFKSYTKNKNVPSPGHTELGYTTRWSPRQASPLSTECVHLRERGLRSLMRSAGGAASKLTPLSALSV